MSKILCVGDLHLSHTRLSLCQSVLAWIESLVKSGNVDSVVYLGDVFDTHSVIRSECLSIWSTHLNSVLKNRVKAYWILGNHEQFKANDSTYNALQSFQLWNNPDLRVITDSCVVDGLGFVPYLNSLRWEDCDPGVDITFTHNTFVGADFGFKVADGGILLDSIKSNLVVSGHIHKQQILQHGDSVVLYPGTPYSWSASDVDMVKSVSVLDTETLKVVTIESPFPTWRKIVVELPDNIPPIPVSIRSCDHILLKVVGLRSEVKAFLSSPVVEDLRSRASSMSISTEFTNSAKESKGISIKAVEKNDIVDEYLKSVYKGSVPIDSLKREILKALEAV